MPDDVPDGRQMNEDSPPKPATSGELSQSPSTSSSQSGITTPAQTSGKTLPSRTIRPELADLHPWLVAGVVVLSLGARNVKWVTLTDVLVVLSQVWGAVLVAYVAILLVRRNARHASLITSWLVVMAFYYGVLFDQIERLPLADGSLIRHAILIAVSLGISTLLWNLPGNLKPLAKFITMTAGIACAVFANSFGQSLIREPKTTWKTRFTSTASSEGAKSESTSETEATPDIYYIILDAYARADVLQHYYKFDNSPFLNDLKQRGFYIADRACTNYPGTAFSLPSSLNMRYHDPLDKRGGMKPLAEMVRTNEVMVRLKERGYKLIHFNTRFIATACSDLAHISLGEQTPLPAGARMLWLHLTAHGAMRFLNGGEHGIYAAQHRRAFADLSEVPKIDSPKFTFFHLVAPHPPYVFEQDGTVNCNMDQDDRASYVSQLVAVNREVTKVVDTILAQSKKPPLIIIQSDHGPGFFKTEPTAENPNPDQSIHERIPILNAYHVPTSIRERLYPTISPVNSFRIVLSELFGLDYPLLEERHFTFHAGAWATLADVTDQIHDGIPAPGLAKPKLSEKTDK